MIKTPCHKDCPERSATCHSVCERYAEYAEKVKRSRELRGMSQAMEYTVNYMLKHKRKWK